MRNTEYETNISNNPPNTNNRHCIIIIIIIIIIMSGNPPWKAFSSVVPQPAITDNLQVYLAVHSNNRCRAVCIIKLLFRKLSIKKLFWALLRTEGRDSESTLPTKVYGGKCCYGTPDWLNALSWHRCSSGRTGLYFSLSSYTSVFNLFGDWWA